MTRKTKIVLSEDEKVYRLIEILGRKNPHINTVAKIKNLIVWRDSPEDVLQGAIDALMFRFKINDNVKEEALRFIEKIKNFKIPEVEKPKITRTTSKINLEIREKLNEKASLIFEMVNAGMSKQKIHKLLGFDFSYSTMSKYVLREHEGQQ